VTQVIEQQMNGLDGLLYMSSTSESTGIATVTLTFENGTNPDIAQVQVQNKLQTATAAAAQAGAAAGRAGRQVGAQLPDGRRLRLARRELRARI
jgi:multidrug efflux pump subunit AcrB